VESINEKIELESIFSEGRTIKLAGKDILIKTVPLGHLPKVISLLLKMKPFFSQGKFDTAKFSEVIIQDFGEVMNLIAITTNLTDEEIKNLNLAATAKIAKEIIEDNTSFLENQVFPILKELKTLGKNQQQTGGGKSNG
jgi:hypothetical protein